MHSLRCMISSHKGRGGLAAAPVARRTGRVAQAQGGLRQLSARSRLSRFTIVGRTRTAAAFQRIARIYLITKIDEPRPKQPRAVKRAFNRMPKHAGCNHVLFDEQTGVWEPRPDVVPLDGPQHCTPRRESDFTNLP
jgi:hypothetical protein